MKRRYKTDLCLLCLTLTFTAGTLLLRKGTEETEKNGNTAPEKVYYLTHYEDAGDLLAVQIQNSSGTLTIVDNQGTYITDTALEGIQADPETVDQLFEAVTSLRVDGPVEGAGPEDPQFGLDEPAANIFIEDQKESGIRFLLGKETPDGESFYVCTAGGKEVFTIPAGYREYFLEDVNRYLDLRIFRNIDAEQITSVSVSAEGEQNYSLEVSGNTAITGARTFSLTYPASLPVPLSQMRNMIFSSMEEVRAVPEMLPEDGTEMTVRAEALIGTEDGKQYRFQAGTMPDGSFRIADMTEGFIYQVEQLPDWITTDAAGLLGGKLLSLNTADTEMIELTASGETVLYEFDDDNDWADLLEKLNQITIRNLEEDQADTGEEVLRCRIYRKGGGEKQELVFYEASDRQCHIRVNGDRAFVCALSSISPVIRNMQSMQNTADTEAL